MDTRNLVLFFCLLFLAITAVAAPSGIKVFPHPQPAPGFQLTDLTGITHKLDDYRHQTLILSFWATWCTPCLKELPSLQRAARLLNGDGIRILAVNMGETAQEIERFVADRPIGLRLLPDPDSEVSIAWNVRGLPTSYVVNGEGDIAIRVVGGIEWDSSEMLEILRKLARQP